jgi:hypothetical protein
MADPAVGTTVTFEAYIEDRWEMSRPQAYRLIERGRWPTVCLPWETNSMSVKCASCFR